MNVHPKIDALLAQPAQLLFAGKLTVADQTPDPLFAKQVNEDFHQRDPLVSCGYCGKLIEWVATTCLWLLVIVKRNDDTKGFVVLLRRWVVKRTMAWLCGYRRLSKDYERLPENSEA